MREEFERDSGNCYILDMVRRLLIALVIFAWAGAAKFPMDEYRARRANLRKELSGVLVLFAHTEARDQVYRAAPEPNFYYLTGWTEPGARLLLTPKREILFLPSQRAPGALRGPPIVGRR